MKTIHMISLFLMLFSISSAAEAPSPVVDTAGNHLLAGAAYYILPVIRGRGGGLTLAATGNKTCPLDVVQDQLEVNNGSPLTFHPVNAKKGVVRVSTDHNIKFSGKSTCAQSTVWKLYYDDSIGKYFVTSGGVEGNPGRTTTGNWFKIEEYESDYKLVFCPTVCNFCKVICRNVGVLVEGGKRRLTLVEDVYAPFRVMFKKAAA